jgi:hypothetical protein
MDGYGAGGSSRWTFLYALTVVVKLGPANARQLISTPQATWFRQSTAFRSLAMECHTIPTNNPPTWEQGMACAARVVTWSCGASGDLPARRRLFQSLKWSASGRGVPEEPCQGNRTVQMLEVERLAQSDCDKIKEKMEENEIALARL